MDMAVESGQLAGEACEVTSDKLVGFGSSVPAMSLGVVELPSELFRNELFGYIPAYNTAPPGPNPPVVSTLDSCHDLAEFAAKIKSDFGTMADLPHGLVVEDFIGNTLFGQVYRAKYNQQRGLDNVQEAKVMVKAWNYIRDELKFPPTPSAGCWRRTAQGRFHDEMKLLTEPSPLLPHDNIVKLIGSGLVNGRLAVVYDLDPLDTLRNILPQDDFDWVSRIKVAIQFASLVEAFHSQQLNLRNICADNLVLDKHFHPKLVDFGMLVGGDFGGISRGEFVHGCMGYKDPYVSDTVLAADVFSYGVLLLELVTKRAAFEREKHRVFLHAWAKNEYDKMTRLKEALPRRRKREDKLKYPSLVHESFTGSGFFYAKDGAEITKLALRCVSHSRAPTIKTVVKRLRQLEVAKILDL
ncbi:hypothetical protein Vadar_013670 [Vaccinium darrowii]|uniref:Uncharacterized protein n=1 Tax=Vaccinium darrowii TaxID=229202 RepID=A0ACB7XHN6_9ERIC|nr:hypothetical protein Vadar_013670 [Vaccinium darrowii]